MFYTLNKNFRNFYKQGDFNHIRAYDKFPIYINNEALQILMYCDGINSIEDIIKKISFENNIDYGEAKKIVVPFLEYYSTTNLLSANFEKLDEPIQILTNGSEYLWTPLHITIELTYSCTLKCKHCYAKAGEGSYIDNELLLALIDEIISLKVCTVQLTGGEPTLHPLFDKILKKLVSNKINVTVTTNGYFNNEIVTYFDPLSNNNGYVQVSIDGLESSHNHIRGIENSFETAIATIKDLVSKQIQVRVATCLINQSEKEIFNLVELIKNLGVTHYTVAKVDILGRALDNELDSIYDESKIKYLIEELKVRFESDNFYIIFQNECNFDSSLFKNCGAGYNTIKINPDGFVHYCILSEQTLGRISINNNLKSFLSTNFEKMKENASKHPPSKTICNSCKKLDYCLNCIARAQNLKCRKYICK